MDIYGYHRPDMEKIMHGMVSTIEEICRTNDGSRLFDHISCRIKSDTSTREKLRRLEIPENEENALRKITDSIGIRVVCLFIDDIDECIRKIQEIPGCTVIKKKDYIRNAKPNGYRSYHMILEIPSVVSALNETKKGQYFVEVQLRTIAMDTWAALEHELKYKKNISNPELIIKELHRCANDLAACDVSMQTIRRIIRDS